MTGGHLAAGFAVSRPALTVRVDLQAAAGEVVALLGPNGAGKSTVLQVLAGLLRPQLGQVQVGDRILTRQGAVGSPDVLIRPEQRRVGLMDQRPLLFPHLSALDNLAFGPRAQGVPRAAANAAAAQWLDRIGLAGLGHRRPQQLSGGQAQRLALARALAAEPEVLLLDEPLGALDAQTAPEIRQVLRTHLRATGTTAVLVTHDVLDAAVLADRVLVIEHGVVVDQGTSATVLATPRSGFGAALAGLDLLTGTAQTDAGDGGLTSLRTASGLVVTGISVGRIASGGLAAAVFAPSGVAVHLSADGGSARNRWWTQVQSMESLAGAVRIRTAGPDTIAVDVTAAAVAELDLAVGRRIEVSVKAAEVRIHQR